MNPRDLPEVVADLIIEMHEVQSELRAVNGRPDRLEQTMEQVVAEQRGMREEQRGVREEQRGMREDLQAMPDRIGAAVSKSLEPFLNRLLDHDDQLRTHDACLRNLEGPR